MSEEIKTISTEEVAELVEYIAKNLVDEPDAVKVTIKRTDAENASEGAEGGSDDEPEQEGQITIELSVAKDDMGKVIGKQGRIAKAIRTVVRAATVRSDIKYRIDIL
ncbi:MAG: KH domain-containing protein [Clostridiales bacterium]|nr:KH domain-containing protein [Clostridiales bacterium]